MVDLKNIARLTIILSLLFSCNQGKEEDDLKQKTYNELILGTWDLQIPEEVIERSYPGAYIVSMTCYKQDSTWESFHGDYSSHGIYWIEDDWLFKSTYYSSTLRDTFKSKILEIDSVKMYLQSEVTTDTSLYIRKSVSGGSICNLPILLDE